MRLRITLEEMQEGICQSIFTLKKIDWHMLFLRFYRVRNGFVYLDCQSEAMKTAA
jgi:hypothetical protein